MIKKIADSLFKWYCNPDYYPDIKGDLEELYTSHLKDGRSTATFKYCIDVLLLFRISLIRPLFKNSIIKSTGMFRNYFKISIRNLVRHKMFTAINVVGLAVGLASFLLMNEYIKFERGYDSFHRDADKLYRVSYVRVHNGVDGDKDAMAAYPVGKTLQENLPEIVNHTVSKKLDFAILKNGEISFKERFVITADLNFLKMFNYPIIEGDLETMLSSPESIVLTQSRARAYFGNVSPIGKTLEITHPYKASLKVTGVLQDIPDNTHYTFDILLSDKILEGGQDYNHWNWNNYYVFVKSETRLNVEEFERKANNTLDDHINGTENDRTWSKNGTRVDVHSVQDIYLQSDFGFEPQLLGSERAVNFLIIISIFIIAIAWVNYVNLSTARALDRAKEVGLRKVIGAYRVQLIIQFLCEALIVNLIGAILAIGLADLALPYFNQLTGKRVFDHVWNHAPFLYGVLIFTFFGAFASGFYPALVLSDFKPITVLKGKFQNSKRGVALRKILVIAQFGASLVLIASTFIIYLQVNYMRGKDIGISLEQVVNITVPQSGAESEEEEQIHINKLNAFKRALLDHSAVESVGGTSNLPGGETADINSTTTVVRIAGMTEPTEGTTFVQYNDEGFLDAVDMQLLFGRNFDSKRKSDTAAVMVNESFLRRMNISNFESVVGEKIKFGRKEESPGLNIIGVVKDFNRTTLKSNVEPTLYAPWFEADDLLIELETANYQSGLDFVKKTWSNFYPDAPFNYTFLDERFAALYDQDERFGDTFMIFAVLAIFIAILGLFGLSSFLSVQRSKEVGVRKVLGASTNHILFLFFKDFAMLIGISAILSFPLVFFLMNSWLDNYAYRIDFPWFILAVSLVIVTAFALVTVGYQALKVTSLNPAKTLKYE